MKPLKPVRLPREISLTTRLEHTCWKWVTWWRLFSKIKLGQIMWLFILSICTAGTFGTWVEETESFQMRLIKNCCLRLTQLSEIQHFCLHCQRPGVLRVILRDSECGDWRPRPKVLGCCIGNPSDDIN